MKKFNVLIGKSASGKDHLYKELIKSTCLKGIVSYTDRPMRENETQDVEYHFVSKDEMKSLIEQSAFIEYRKYKTKLNGIKDIWTYGTPFGDYLNNNNSYLLILDLNGTLSFIEKYGIENCDIFYIDCDRQQREERAKARKSFSESEWNRRVIDDDKALDIDLVMSKIPKGYFIDNNSNDDSAFKEIIEYLNRDVKHLKDIKFYYTTLLDYLENCSCDFKFYLDFDCTLTKSLDPIVKILNEKYGTNVEPKDIKSWNFREIKPDLTDEEIEEIFTTSSFFGELEFYEGVEDFLNKYRDKIIIVTKGKSLNIYNKQLFLANKGYGDIHFIGLDIGTSKREINMQGENFAISVFIDDSTENLKSSNADIKIQFREFGETEWNKGWEGKVFNKWN